MKRFALMLALLFVFPVVSLAQDAGMAMMAMDAGAEMAPAAPAVDPGSFFSLKGFVEAVKSGNGWLIAASLLFAFVGGMRVAGRKIHDMIPDESMWDKPLWFIFETKVGGWLMNWLTAIAGALGSAQMAGMAVDMKAWQVAIMASTTATALIELKDDVMEWWAKRKALAAAAPKP